MAEIRFSNHATGYTFAFCFVCQRPAYHCSEWIINALDMGAIPSMETCDQLVREDGTYNPETNTFACDYCYVTLEALSGKRLSRPLPGPGWKAPKREDWVRLCELCGEDPNVYVPAATCPVSGESSSQ